MDVLLTGDVADLVADLDGPMLAALWTRAVLAADPDLVAACEAEASLRGVRPQTLVASVRRPLVAAKAKKDDEPTHIDPGKKSKGAESYDEIVSQAQKNIKEGKSYDTGQQTYKNSKGYNPYRKGKGEKGGGQFTTKEGAETSDPEAARKGAELQEDDPSIPDKSPKGAKIKDFRDGMMIYEDGTRFDGDGWRDEKGRALDSKGNVIKKSGSKSGDAKAVEREKEKARKEAERAQKKKDQEESHAWDTAESRRKADEAAKDGNYGPLLSILERNEVAARKKRDLSKKTDTPLGDDEVTAAQKELAEAKAKAAEAKTAKDAANKVEREKKSAEAQKEREAKTAAEQKAEYAEIAKNYPAWEKELRDKYADVGLSENELRDLIIRDRARRVRLLPRRKRSAGTSDLTITPGGPTNGQLVTTAAAGRYDPALHPKGKDGQWIEKFGLVDVFGLSGFQHGQRGHKQVQGQVVEIIPNQKNPGDPVIRIKVTDPRWNPKAFGETVDVKRSQVAERVKPKGKLPPKTPVIDIAAPAVVQLDNTGGIPPAKAPTPNLTPHPDGPHLAPLTLPPEWAKWDNATRVDWVEERMNADLIAWRGEPEFGAPPVDLSGFDAGIAFNLANTYRDLVNWDPETAKRIDNPLLGNQSIYHDGSLTKNAIAVAHPGTAHVGGIGKKIGPAQIVFGNKYVIGMDFWQKQKQSSDQAKVPWSTSSMTGDPSVTLIHEFGHQRQFRYLDIAMADAGKAWSPAVREDGFGLVPDSSNWPETQALRYQIPKLSQTKYGQSKSSEGFAEGIAEQALGISSPELDLTFEQWDAYMGVSLHLPAERHAQSKPFDDLTPTQQDQFWQTNGPYLELPGMRDHYPDSAAAYDAWVTGKPVQAPEPVVVNAADGSPINAGQTVDLGGETYMVTATKLSPKAYGGGHFDSPEGAGPIPQQGMVKLQSAYGSDMGWYLADAVTPSGPDEGPAAMAQIKTPTAAVAPVPATVKGPGGTVIPLTTLSDDTGQFEPGGWADPATVASVQEGLERVNASYPQAPPLRTIGIRPEQTALGNKSIDTITVSPAFHDPAIWEQKQKDSWLFAGNGTPAATIFHEYGHIMDGALTPEQRQPLDAIVRAPVTYEVNGQQITVPRWQSGAAGVANPSAYASESPYEFVAEALTDVEFNGADAAPISHEIAAIFTAAFGGP